MYQDSLKDEETVYGDMKIKWKSIFREYDRTMDFETIDLQLRNLLGELYHHLRSCCKKHLILNKTGFRWKDTNNGKEFDSGFRKKTIQEFIECMEDAMIWDDPDILRWIDVINDYKKKKRSPHQSMKTKS